MKKHAPLVVVVILFAAIAGGIIYTQKLSADAREAQSSALAAKIKITELEMVIEGMKRTHESDLARERGKYAVLHDTAAKQLLEVESERDAMRTKLEQSRAGKVADPRVPTGTTLSVSDINMRKIKQSSDYIYYAWTAKIANPLSHPEKANTHILMYDAKGFLLTHCYGNEQSVPELSYTILSGSGMVEKNLWDQVERYRVELN